MESSSDLLIASGSIGAILLKLTLDDYHLLIASGLNVMCKHGTQHNIT